MAQSRWLILDEIQIRVRVPKTLTARKVAEGRRALYELARSFIKLCRDFPRLRDFEVKLEHDPFAKRKLGAK